MSLAVLHFQKSILNIVGHILFWHLYFSQLTDDYCFVIFGFVNVVWATVYLEAWKRKSAEHAYSWGTLDSEDELLVEPRPLYHVRVHCENTAIVVFLHVQIIVKC